MVLVTALRLRLSKLSLRARVAVLFALLGLVVSTCLALVAAHFSDSYVHRLIGEMLRVEGDYLRERYADDGRTPHPQTQHFYAYATNATGRNAPPAELAKLEPGFYEIEDRGERHVAVYAVNGEKLYVVLDIGLESTRERRLARDLIALVLFGSGLSAWLGWFWAGRAIEPVRRLARQVEGLEPSRRGVAPLAADFAVDEVGALAQAFDGYQEKLYEYMRRERTFTADASHELRTPLAVIRGAIEVMLDNGCPNEATEKRLWRMQRGADELRDLLDALLVLARSDEQEAHAGHTPDLNAVVDSLLHERADLLREKHMQLRQESTPDVAISAPQKVLGVVIGNLLRAVTQFADGGTLQIKVAADALTVAHERDPSATAVAVPAPQHARLDVREQALGLGMIRRVCERWGWTLDEKVDTNGGHVFLLRFG
jgi:signal transduction histidine kinase